MIELHCHTNASDGFYTPTEVVELAFRNGVTDLALTDHDSVAGIEEAVKAAEKHNINIIPGTELNCEFNNGELHIVGLFIDIHNPDITNFFAELKEYRLKRNIQLLAHLQNQGLDITEEEVTEGGIDFGTVGRPNFARVIARKGYEKNIFAAFDKYLADTAIPFVKRIKISDKRAIDMIHQAGGIAILAHPNQTGIKNHNELVYFISNLKNKGLDGMEVYYNGYKHKTIKEYRKIAVKLDLLQSGGSDFHSHDKGTTSKIGYYGQDNPIPDVLLDKMKEYLSRQ